MSGITDPSEEYFKDGLWAWVSTAWKKLVADASSFLQVNVAAQDIDVEVTQQAAADLTPGVMGWDGSAWHKLPMLWGITDTVSENVQNLNASAGLNNLIGATVPAGEVWVIEHYTALNNTNAITLLQFHCVVGGFDIRIKGEAAVAAGVWGVYDTRVTLAAGEYVYASLTGCVAGDDIYFRYCGYKMKVAE